MARANGADAIVADLDGRLHDRSRTWLKFSTLGTIGGQKLTRKFVDDVQAAMAEAGIHHFPPELDGCKPNDTVLIARTPFPSRGLDFFQNERELRDFIVKYYNRITPFARSTLVKKEKPLGNFRYDLLFRERGGGLIVCELKHGSGRFEIASQICSYMETAIEAAARRPRPPKIKGVVITGSPNPAQELKVAQWCDESGHRIDWYYYRLQLNLDPAQLSSR